MFHTELALRDAPALFADIEFRGVVAHRFDHVLSGNILYDIVEAGAAEFVAHWSDVLHEGARFGVPEGAENAKDMDQLAAWITARGQHGYEVLSSYGLSGFVLASSIASVSRAQRWVRSSASA